jgi:peptidoglycan/xylan/chitin deacetylase (PgdA/CDA1 family)
VLLPLLLPLILVAQPLPANSLPDTLDLSSHTVVFSADDGYHSVFENVYPLLRQYGMTMTLAVIGGCVAEGQPSYRTQDRFMNRAEIRELIDSCRIEIASHTMSHAWLSRLDSVRAWHEVAYSRTFLESLFGTEVITFVYPYGDMNARARRMVRRAGYRLARAVRPGTPNFWVDPYRIPETELRIETPLSAVQNRVRNHDVTVLLLHRIVRQPQVFTEWSLADFSALLDWLHARRVRTTTLSGLYRQWWQERLGRILLEQLEQTRKPARLFEDVHVDATRTPHPGR